MIEFTVKVKTVSGDNAREMPWAKARRIAKNRDATAWTWLAEGISARVPALPVTVTFTRLSPMTMDTDGLSSACKGIRDEVAFRLGLPVKKLSKMQARPVAEDSDPRVTWAYRQDKCARGVFGVRVTIERRKDGE